jgi:hypothetical protein
MDSNSDTFETEQEFLERKNDAMDKLRSETARHLRKYARRIKRVGEARVTAAFAFDANADPELVADEALRVASQGFFLAAGGSNAVAQVEAGR